MYEITIENRYGEKLCLTDTSDYITKATGLGPVNSNIVTTTVANYGGEQYVSSRKQKRNIVLTIYVRNQVEENRIKLYRYIRSHDWIRVYYKNGTRDVYIDGYVESAEVDLFTQTQTMQVSIICPQPNFIDIHGNNVDNNNVAKGFYMPWYTLLTTNLVRGGADLICPDNVLLPKDERLLILGSGRLDNSILG